MKRVRFAILAVATVSLFSQTLVAQCAELTPGQTEKESSPASRALHATKVQYALAVISAQHYQSQTQDCVANALFFLGKSKVEEAIPRMIELLNFEHAVANPIRVRTRNEQYPAITALAAIGKPAVPAIVRAIATADIKDVVKVDNATYALMTIYQEEPGAGIEVLRKAAGAEQDDVAAQNFHKALEKAESIWCKASSRCDSQPK